MSCLRSLHARISALNVDLSARSDITQKKALFPTNKKVVRSPVKDLASETGRVTSAKALTDMRPHPEIMPRFAQRAEKPFTAVVC